MLPRSGAKLVLYVRLQADNCGCQSGRRAEEKISEQDSSQLAGDDSLRFHKKTQARELARVGTCSRGAADRQERESGRGSTRHHLGPFCSCNQANLHLLHSSTQRRRLDTLSLTRQGLLPNWLSASVRVCCCNTHSQASRSDQLRIT